MNTPNNIPGKPVTITEIADLTAWLRQLSTRLADRSGAADPAELAAFHTAKADLLARIHNQHIQAAQPNSGKESDKDTR